MAETEDKQPPSAVQVPSRGIQKTAPGVFSYRDAPLETGASLHTGDLVGGRFLVERYLGSSGGGVSYLSIDQKSDEQVVVKVLTMEYPGDERYNGMATFIRTASKVSHRNLTKLIGMGKTDANEIFVALEFVRGATLSNVVRTRREQNKKMHLYDVFTILAHACDALTAVHDAGMTHAVLTPYNIYIDSHGIVKVGNLGFGLLAAKNLYAENSGPFVDSIYVAPEVPEAPELISSAVDIYSLGMIAAEMLSPTGLPDDRDEAKAEAIMMLSKYPSNLSQLVAQSLGEDLAGRPKTTQSFRDQLQRAVEAANVNLQAAAPADCLPIEPAIEQSEAFVEENLFDIPELQGLGVEQSDPSKERYLVQKNGLDYGPYTPDQVIEQLHKDEIDEFTPVLDRITTERIALGEIDVFKEKVREYIPKREERKRLEAERRAELEKVVKKGGQWVFVVGILVGLFFLTAQVLYYITRPEPVPLPIGSAFAEFDFKFLPPPKEFTAVAVDKDVMQSIFNPQASEEEIAKVLKKRRKSSKRKKRPTKTSKKNGSDEDSNITEIDMSSGGSTHILSDEEVNDVILSNFGGLRACILTELKSNPKFRGVTVKFFIRPSGTTGGVKVNGGDGTVAECLKSKFRRMKFPDHGGFNRGVVYPLNVQ